MKELKKLLDRPIAFHRVFVSLAGSVNAALFLSQAFYWANRTSDPVGWFYKTQGDWEEETGLSRREQDGARAKLRAIGVLHEELRGVPARLFYRVDVEALYGGMHQTAKLDAPHPPADAPNRQTVCTEPPNLAHQTAKLITTETTAEITQRGLMRPVNPDSGEELSAANWLLEELCVPADNSLRKLVGECIRHLAKEGGTVETATKFIFNAGTEAKKDGEVINRFWFSDRQYLPPPPKKVDPIAKMKFAN